MLLRNRLGDPDVWTSLGMFFLAAGIVAQRFIHPPCDFWAGFVMGFSGSMIGLSIVFNIRGLVLRRDNRP